MNPYRPYKPLQFLDLTNPYSSLRRNPGTAGLLRGAANSLGLRTRFFSRGALTDPVSAHPSGLGLREGLGFRVA